MGCANRFDQMNTGYLQGKNESLSIVGSDDSIADFGDSDEGRGAEAMRAAELGSNGTVALNTQLYAGAM